MKEKLTRNIGLKILSVILAILLWLVITNVADPIDNKTFKDVQVKILNEGILTSRGIYYEIIKNESISFTVAARRSILDNLRQSDFRVTADLAHLSDVDAVQIDITPLRQTEEIVITSGIQMLLIKPEELFEKNFKVNVRVKGEVTDGYHIGKTSASPNQIRVTGPRSRVERIEDVIVEVDVNGLLGTFHTVEKPKAIDNEGNVIDSQKLRFSKEDVIVNIGLLKKKTISVQIQAVGEPARGYVMGEVEYSPKEIEVAGTEEALRGIKYLPINEDISGAKDSIEKDIDLQLELDKYDVILVGEDRMAALNIPILPLETKEISIWPREIKIKNVAEDLNVTINTTASIPIKIIGLLDNIAGVTKLTLDPYIDLTDFRIGTYLMEIKCESSEGVTIANNPTVSVTITGDN